MPPQHHRDDADNDVARGAGEGAKRNNRYKRFSLEGVGRINRLTDPRSADEALAGSGRRRASFLVHFSQSDGPPQIVLLCLLLALALGSTIGVVPAVVSDRYARLRHGYSLPTLCADVAKEVRPAECLLGSNDAQNVAAAAGFVSNALTFLTSAWMGSISDEHGRRGVLILGIFLSLLAPGCLVLLQLRPAMSPAWYYAAHASTGVVNWIAVALSSLSDSMPSEWRAPSFGMTLAGFSCGFAFSPLLAVAFGRFGVSVAALALLGGGFVFALVRMPETLPSDVAEEARRVRRVEAQAALASSAQRGSSAAAALWCRRFARALMRPMRELSILNRNKLFRLLSALAFFSGMVSSADHTLLVYYVEERFGFNDRDVGLMFVIVGVLGIVVQGAVLKPLNDCVGERLVVVVAFFFGAVHNFLYGIASTKRTIFVAAAFSSFTGMSFPTISAIKSNNVDELEQGRIQGALYSLSSLASAVGPVSLRYVYHETKEGSSIFFGPGTMFVFAAALYLVATGFAVALPKDQANSQNTTKDRINERALSDESSIDSYGAIGDPLL